MKILLGTESSLKISAIEMVLGDFSKRKLIKSKPQIVPKKVKQLLHVTPIGKQTYQFAKIRAQEMFELYKSEGDFFVGVENGLITRFGRTYEECWCVIFDKKKEMYTGYSSGLELPKDITKEMRKGNLHHEILTKRAGNSKSSRQTWGMYTNSTILRERSIEEAFRNAFYYAATSLLPIHNSCNH